ncbi:hypothetical protein I4F81_003519 [Pyropia yezoensis]|uniref:Uncharacterized protein n=1 Tax=Pyropia yezoensis TaxID=2788 RepID=A0ACC3BSN3_PYRYE|nr:hypothetical protein I4F81_003519 [Neopyropia yezoensis]
MGSARVRLSVVRRSPPRTACAENSTPATAHGRGVERRRLAPLSLAPCPTESSHRAGSWRCFGPQRGGAPQRAPPHNSGRWRQPPRHRCLYIRRGALPERCPPLAPA